MLVEDRERRIQPGSERVGSQHPRAERVDRRDPGAFGRTRRGLQGRRGRPCRRPRRALRLRSERPEPDTDAVAQLSRRLLGERDREDPPDVDAVIDDRPNEALDEHGGLTATGARVEQQITLTALDRTQLLFGELHHESITKLRSPQDLGPADPGMPTTTPRARL